MGSHAGVIDAFLCKLIDKVKGHDELNRLMNALNHQGFEFAEGFDLKINNYSDQENPTLRVKFVKENENGEIVYEFDKEVKLKILDEIIDDRKLAD